MPPARAIIRSHYRRIVSLEVGRTLAIDVALAPGADGAAIDPAGPRSRNPPDKTVGLLAPYFGLPLNPSASIGIR
jgi:hypothetical protein